MLMILRSVGIATAILVSQAVVLSSEPEVPETTSVPDVETPFDISCDVWCEAGFVESFLDSHGIVVGGLLTQSVNTNSRNPTNLPTGNGNLPGGLFLYRNDEYMLNWLGLSVERPTETDGDGWDAGFEFDVVYGTDYFSLQSRGLEQEGDGSNKWNSDFGHGVAGGLMGVALPQLFAAAAVDDVTVKAGKFFHPLGFSRYEPNLNNIANTRSYSAIYGEFATVTGIQADLAVNEQLVLTSAIHRGDANWEDNNGQLSFYTGFNWVSRDGDTELRYMFDVGPEDDAGRNDQYVHAIVFQTRFCKRWLYLFHNNYGYVRNGAGANADARWYGIEQHLAYEVNEKIVVGIRYEWFDDIDGARVAPSPGPGVFHLLDCGGTYRVTEKCWIRPELRWEWYDPDGRLGPGPFGNGRHRDQFIASLSVLLFL